MYINPISPIYRASSQKHGKSERESPWYRYGTDAEYQAFCRSLPSALSGKFPTVYAHYRHGGAGLGIKPPFSGLPLTWDEHTEQTRVGQKNFMPDEWWQKKVSFCLNEWRKQNDN